MTRNWILPVLLASGCFAQNNNEIGLTLGAIVGTRNDSPDRRFGLGAGTALQANYGRRLLGCRTAALFGEVHLLANPQRLVNDGPGGATRDVATLYVTPGVRLKFRPAARVAPYVLGGGGYALYEQSLTTIDGRPNGAPRHIHRGALTFGGGLDIRALRWLAFRTEFRDFYTGSPAFNLPLRGGQHNLVAGGGFVLLFGRSE